MLINTTLGMSNLKAGKPFFGWNFFLQLFTNPSIVIKIINVKQMIIRKRKQFWLYSDRKKQHSLQFSQDLQWGFFPPCEVVVWKQAIR